MKPTTCTTCNSNPIQYYDEDEKGDYYGICKYCYEVLYGEGLDDDTLYDDWFDGDANAWIEAGQS